MSALWSQTKSILPGALSVGAFAAFWLEAFDLHGQLDDAYISYRYARNLVEGFGLVFNPGEYVEGFTNLLWTLLVAAGLALGGEAKVVGHVLGVASAGAVLAATAAYSYQLLPPEQRGLAGLAPWLVMAFAPFAIWATSGMETPLFAAAVTATLAAGAAGRRWLAAIAAMVATLTRPEGVLVAAAVLGIPLLVSRPHAGTSRLGRSAWRPAVLYALFLLAYEVLRLTYYGAFLPNTFYAKVGGIPLSSGLAYLGDFLAAGAAGLLLPAGAAVLRFRGARAGGALLLLTMLYVVGVGGDVFGNSRFLVPVLPALVVLAIAGMADALATPRRAGCLIVACVPATGVWFVFGPVLALLALGAGLLLPVPVAADSTRFRNLRRVGAGTLAAVAAILSLLVADVGIQDLRHPLATSQRSRRVATAWRQFGYFEKMTQRAAALLREQQPPIRLLAVGAIGVIGYDSRLPIIDYLGLVNSQIARSAAGASMTDVVVPGHQRSNADYLFARKPDFIIIMKKSAEETRQLPAVSDIWDHPELSARYEWVEGPGLHSGYRRKPER